MALSFFALSGLCAASFTAGVVDAIAGGGGLLTVPALLAAGLPPHIALGTNKGQGVFGAMASLWRYARAGQVDPSLAKVTFPMGMVGSFAGATLVLAINPSALRTVVLTMLVGAAALVVLRPPTIAIGIPKPSAIWIAPVLALGIGAYDGFFGPGSGTFLLVCFASFLGRPLQKASADAKVVNFASGLMATLLFGMHGTILWSIALPMAVANFSGGFIGAQLAIKGGDRLVRRVVLTVVAALMMKIARDLFA